MKRCVIVGGAPIENGERIRGLLSESDYFIYCDSGLKHLETLGFAPNLVIGDFDSFERPKEDLAETILLPREKDYTDTAYGVKEALARGFEDILLVGVLGARLDHSLVNLYTLLEIDEKGKNGAIADDFSIISIISRRPAEIGPEWPFFSLVNIDGSDVRVSIRGAKYQLTDAQIRPDFQYATSNETLPGQTATVSCSQGRLLLIKDWG